MDRHPRWPAVLGWSIHDFEAETPFSKGGDDEAAGRQWRVRLIVARAAERDQAIEVEVRTAARAFDDVMDVKAAAATTSFTAPAGAAAYLALNRLPLEAGSGRATAHRDRVQTPSANGGTT